jgi:mercuric ion transport protein
MSNPPFIGGTKLKIELIFDSDCPNVEATRNSIRAACSSEGLEAKWQEWDKADPNAPEYARKYGSPTILVDGKDLENFPESAGSQCCRLYESVNGEVAGVPGVETIISALRKTNFELLTR